MLILALMLLAAPVQTTTPAGTSAANAQAVQGVTGGVPTPVSAASLPLPTGGATSALQTTGNTSLASLLAAIAGGLPASLDSGNLRCAVESGSVTTHAASTTTATAPVGGNLTAATATSVYAGASGICQVAVSNLDSTIAMTCGQTNAVSATVGLYVAAHQTYTTGWGYGGALYCFPASGTPAFSVQVNACP
jgi:hypothetical protein